LFVVTGVNQGDSGEGRARGRTQRPGFGRVLHPDPLQFVDGRTGGLEQ
jgi:hypothetical protein